MHQLGSIPLSARTSSTKWSLWSTQPWNLRMVTWLHHKVFACQWEICRASPQAPMWVARLHLIQTRACRGFVKPMVILLIRMLRVPLRIPLPLPPPLVAMARLSFIARSWRLLLGLLYYRISLQFVRGTVELSWGAMLVGVNLWVVSIIVLLHSLVYKHHVAVVLESHRHEGDINVLRKHLTLPLAPYMVVVLLLSRTLAWL
jgi:hypothetical protein